MSASLITTDPADWLHNSHAGALLVREFLDPAEIAVPALADSLGVPMARIAGMIDGTQPVDAELDLRLARYFRVSEGFFLGLEADYALLEAKRAKQGEIDQIVPRAA